MKRLSKILPHITIILAGMFIVFWILDILNPTMNFIKQKNIQQASAGILHISHNNSDTSGLLSAQERQKRIELMQSHTALHFLWSDFPEKYLYSS